jgi:hypothetical protein
MLIHGRSAMLVRRSLLAVGAFGISLLCFGQDAPDAAKKKEATIRELLQVTGAAKLGTQMIDQMGAALGKQMGPDFTEYWKEFSSKVNVDDLENLIVPIYAKHFETSDLEEMIRFNKTPVGQKVIRETPALVQESMAAGMEWGQALGKKAMETFHQRKDK